jgi:DNA-binding NarL/FixJ family response regulator
VTIRVVVVDDQATIRLGLSMIVDDEPDMAVVGEAGTAAGAVEAVRSARPDVVLVDVQMPGPSGIEAVAAIAADPDLRATRCLVLTTFHDEEYVAGALRAGADGFLLKDAHPDELVAAIRRVHRGDALLDPAVTRGVIARFADLAPAAPAAAHVEHVPLERLSPREREVLVAVARGLSNAEAGALLHLTDATVKSHVRSILAKLGRTSRVQLVIAAYDAGLVRPAGDPGGP